MLWIWGLIQSSKEHMEPYPVGRRHVGLEPVKINKPSPHKGLFIVHGFRKNEQISANSILQKKVWAELNILW